MIQISRTTRLDLFDLIPKHSHFDDYVLLGWSELERAHRGLQQGGVSNGAMIRALGYMMEGDQPTHDDQLVGSFILLPDPGNAVHPAHRFGDEMIDVRLQASNSVHFSEGSLVWVWGTLRILTGNPASHEPLYILENARTEPANKGDILKYFR